MSWISLVSSAFSILSAVISYLQDQQKIDGALAEALNVHLAAAMKEIKDAQDIRDAVARDPNSVLPGANDGFRRD